MSQKFKQREILPDTKYNDILVAKFINSIMEMGKKSIAQAVVYDAFAQIKKTTKKEPLDVFIKALKEVSPRAEVRPQRVGGATYQVPRDVKEKRSVSLAFRWIIQASKAKKGKPMALKLAEELTAASKGEGEAIKKKANMHKMAQANKAFAYLAK